MLYLIGKIFGFLLIMSIALLFDKKKTKKSIIITSIIVLLIGAPVEMLGALDGRLISWPLAFVLIVNSLLINIIPLAIVDVIIIFDRLYEKKWYTKILPWFAGILYGLVFVIVVPLVVMEQVKLYRDTKQVEETVESVAQVWGFILSKELITDWCKPYYELKVYPKKFAETFGSIKLNAENFIVETAKKSGEDISVIQVAKASIVDTANKSYEEDYVATKNKKEQNGGKYSKKDYCKMIDDKADFHISNTKQYFEQLFNLSLDK